jgi:hypothetical protein
MTQQEIKKAIEYVTVINEPSSKKEAFLLLASFNLLNAAIKQQDHKKSLSYGFVKTRVIRLFEYLIANYDKHYVERMYYDVAGKCIYFCCYGMQISFHDLLGRHESIQQFIQSPANVPMPWTGIRLQPVATEIFGLAQRNVEGHIDVSGPVVEILNKARKLAKKTRKTK